MQLEMQSTGSGAGSLAGSRMQTIAAGAKTGGRAALVSIGVGAAAMIGAGIAMWATKKWAPRAYNAMFVTEPAEVNVTKTKRSSSKSRTQNA